MQIVSHELGIPVSLIHLSETRTDTVANSSPTAASASSDLNGMALVDACRKIMGRLEPLKQQNPGITWKDVIQISLKFIAGEESVPRPNQSFIQWPLCFA